MELEFHIQYLFSYWGMACITMLIALKLAILTIFICNYRCVLLHPTHSVPYQIFAGVYEVECYKTHCFGYYNINE